jgi:hypothetical protein
VPALLFVATAVSGWLMLRKHRTRPGSAIR